MSNTLEEIKNEVAKEYKFKDWETMVIEIATRKGSSIGKITEIECRYDIVSERYAEACSKASLEKAMELTNDEKCTYCREYGNLPCDECDEKLRIKKEKAMEQANTLQKEIRIGNYLLGKVELDERKIYWEMYQIKDAEDCGEELTIKE